MSHEEFDKRLKQAFEHEHEAPQAALWEGIEAALNKKPKRKYGLFMLLTLLVIGGIGLSLALVNNNKKIQSYSHSKSIKLAPFNHSHKHQSLSDNNQLTFVTTTSSIKLPTFTLFNNALNQYYQHLPTCGGVIYSDNQWPFNNSNNISNYLAAIETNEETPHMIMSGFQKRTPAFTDESLGSAYRKKAPKWMNSLMSKHHLELSFGPQMSENRLDINKDSQAWVHYHLWDNKNKMTHKGGGFSAKLNYQYKLGKKQQYGLSIGCEYGQRTEAIQLNESSFDIAARDNSGKILQYTQILIKVILGNDTTVYLASSNYALATTNKYKIISIPIEFSRDFAISQHSFAQLSTGLGLTYIQSQNNTHIDMIWGDNKTVSKQEMLNATLNAKLALYTQFNNIGYIGVYAGYKDYLQPWTVNANQYRIHMRDLQIGLSFRKPL